MPEKHLSELTQLTKNTVQAKNKAMRFRKTAVTKTNKWCKK